MDEEYDGTWCTWRGRWEVNVCFNGDGWDNYKGCVHEGAGGSFVDEGFGWRDWWWPRRHCGGMLFN